MFRLLAAQTNRRFALQTTQNNNTLCLNKTPHMCGAPVARAHSTNSNRRDDTKDDAQTQNASGFYKDCYAYFVAMYASIGFCCGAVVGANGRDGIVESAVFGTRAAVVYGIIGAMSGICAPVFIAHSIADDFLSAMIENADRLTEKRAH